MKAQLWLARSRKNHLSVFPTLALSGTYAAATVGVAYSSDLTISGGNGSYSNPRVTVGTLPTWATLSIVSGKLRLSGTPTGSATTVNITVAVDSGDGQTATSAQSFAVAGITFATLSPSDIGSGLSLSGGNLTCTTSNGGSGPWVSVRANIGKSAGKWYFEVKNVSNGSTNGAAILGFMLATDSLATYPGSSSLAATSMGFQANNTPSPGRYQHGFLGQVVSDLPVAVGGFTGLAIDLTAGKLWVRNFGNNNWAGGGDPAAGTTPSFTFTPGSTLYPAFGIFSSPQTITVNFGASAFSGTGGVPSGFNAGWWT